MATEKRKRKEHVPPTCTQVKLPKSRCSGKKFITAIARLAPEKQQAIREMGFGGLLTFACRELRYELFDPTGHESLISQYDFTYHRLNMETDNAITVNEEHVNKVMGIPNSGVDVVILKRTTLSAEILRRWNQGILTKAPTYIRGCLMVLSALFYMAYFYMPSVNVEVTSPLAAAWTDDVMKRRLAAEISTFGGYGYVHVIEARVIDTSESMLRLASSLARDVAALCSRRSGPRDIFNPLPKSTMKRECDRVGGSGNQAIKPSSIKRFKRTCKRIVKRPPTCKSPFVTQCVKQFPKIPHAHRVVADYALAEIGDPSEILCEMYGMYITREEISCLNAIVAIVSHTMNGQQALPACAHYFDPSIAFVDVCIDNPTREQVILTNLKTNATSQVIMDRCRMYLDAGILGHDLGTCDMMFIPVCENNHWHMHVVNFAAGRVEILSSLPLRRGNSISAATRRLSMAINKALHAYTIHMDVDVSTFEHVQPHLVQQLNGFDCGILALKFMEFWNGATLTTSVAEDKLNMYRLQLVVELVLNERNIVRDKIMASCHL
ncbi:hypothetical protein AAG906_029322 [Vitis piasezkii]